MDLRERLSELLARYVQLQAGEETISGYLLQVGEALVLVALVHDGVVDGYELVSLRAIDSVRDGVTDEFYELLLRQAGVVAPVEDRPTLSLDSWRAAIAGLAAAGELISVEHDSGDEEALGFLVGRVEEVDDLRLRLRYLTTTATWRELDVVPTRTIERVGFGSRYFELLAQAARPWQGERLAWADALSPEERESWAPLSGLFEVVGAPLDSLVVRRLCASYELRATNDYVSVGWGIELSAEGECVEGVLLFGAGFSGGEAFSGAFIEGLSLAASREQLFARLGVAHASDARDGEQRVRHRVGPMELLFVYVGAGAQQQLAVVVIAAAEV